MVDINSKTILVVNDEPAVSELLSILLASRGFRSKIVTSGRQALKQVSSEIDLIILDLVLPDVQGIKICQVLKSNPETKNIPIIILSASTNKVDRIESLYIGAEDYLTKPFEAEELFARMDVVFRNRHGMTVNDETAQNHETVRELRRIIDEESINVCFQPIYYLKPMRLLGLEMLSRPQTQGAMASPDIFFKNALKYGLYYEVEMIGWRKAIKVAADHFDGNQKLFLNCDPYLVQSDKYESIKGVFEKLGMSCKDVFLEITERSAVGAFDVFFQRLRHYRDNGFNIAVDDLGAGYASLESIVEIRPEAVKLDRHIVNGVGRDTYKYSIVKLFVGFCRENSIICVAEGIETKEDYEALLELGVDAGQGYYLCRPTSIVDLKAMQALQI